MQCCSCYCNNNADTSYNVYIIRTSAGVLHTVTERCMATCTEMSVEPLTTLTLPFHYYGLRSSDSQGPYDSSGMQSLPNLDITNNNMRKTLQLSLYMPDIKHKIIETP